MPWPAAAIGGGLVAALGGALLVAGLVLIGWLGALDVPVPAMLAFAGRVWLLANGGVLIGDGLQISVVPLGLSVMLAALSGWIAAFAYRQAVQARPIAPTGAQRRRLVLLTAAQLAGGYVGAAVAIAVAVGADPLRAVPGSLLVSFVGAMLGAAGKAGYTGVGPTWLRMAARGGLLGLLGLTVLAAVVLGVAMVQGEIRIAALEQALGFDAAGSVVWALISLFYLPNLLAWTSSWILGAGFTLGDGSLIAPWATQLGMLPSVPMFGALPSDGAGGMAAWLLAGLIPGMLAGVGAVRAKVAPILPAVGAGTVAGLIVGIGYLAWALLSRGALGSVRFAQVGPRVPEVLIGVAILTIGAAVGALVAWLVDRRLGSAG